MSVGSLHSSVKEKKGRPFEAYHLAWLSAHLERTQQWLAERLADGFAVHHTDGNHSNNDPINLVLIEAGDHMLLHNGVKRMPWKPSTTKHRHKPSPEERAAKSAHKIASMRAVIVAHDEALRRKRKQKSAEPVRPEPASVQATTAVLLSAKCLVRQIEAQQIRINQAAAQRLRFLDGLDNESNGSPT